MTSDHLLLQKSSLRPVSERVFWIDCAKGIGIFLVVLGHTLRGLIASSTLESSALLKGVDQWIYAFHMPLFFCLSGLLIERAAAKPLNVLSLQIFVAHSIFSAIARVFLQKVNADPIIHIIVGTAVGIYGSIFLYWVCQKLKFPYAFTLRPAQS